VKPPKNQKEEVCAFNKLRAVPGTDDHLFSVTAKKSSYAAEDFTVGWHDVRVKKHLFFRSVGKRSNIRSVYTTLKCKKATPSIFGKVCGYSDAQVPEYFANAFGPKPAYVCKVPAGHFLLAIRFVLKLSDFSTSAGGRWSVLAGVHKFKSSSDAKKIIQKEASWIYREIKSTKLNTFDINSELNIIPEFIKGTLSWVFNSNINSNYVKDIKVGQKELLTDFGYVKVLPPNTEIIMGPILNGTASVYQICDSYRFTDKQDCGLEVK
jgi:hypothetical protein